MRAALAEMEKTVRQRERDNAETRKGLNAETQRRRETEKVMLYVHFGLEL